MPLNLSWQEIALRLALAFAAGGLIGFNRTEHGRPAGLRTTILVCLAACVSMIQVNLLLPLAGRHPDSFVMNDLMRLPLGILTGMGFIGGGAILRKGDLVLGVTTAATLWFVTVIGLCIGGGQLGLGIAGTLIGMLVLWACNGSKSTCPATTTGPWCCSAIRNLPRKRRSGPAWPQRNSKLSPPPRLTSIRRLNASCVLKSSAAPGETKFVLHNSWKS